jgi:hypothetical protein
MITRTRRRFLQEVSLGGATALIADRTQSLATERSAGQVADTSVWRSRIGLELYTVRDRLALDFEGTLAKVAAMGYTEIEPTSYNDMPPKAFRALLDGLKLAMPSTHAPARGTGADLERQLEGHQVMGIRYTEIRSTSPATSPGPGPRRPATLPNRSSLTPRSRA